MLLERSLACLVFRQAGDGVDGSLEGEGEALGGRRVPLRLLPLLVVEAVPVVVEQLRLLVGVARPRRVGDVDARDAF